MQNLSGEIYNPQISAFLMYTLIIPSLHKTMHSEEELALQLQIGCLSLDEKLSLRQWLEEAIADEQIEASRATGKSGNEIVETRSSGNTTYQLELVKCGKPTCQCAGFFGQKHGPYWYSYQRKGKRLVSKYIGKNLVT